jgi:hypothetical protein
MQNDQRLGFSRRHHGAMKFEVSEPTCIRIVDRVSDEGERLLQLFEIGHRRPLRREANCLAFDGDARLHHIVDDFRLLRKGECEEIVENGQIRTAHDGSDAVADFHHSQHGERTQSLPQNRAANAELRSKIALRDEAVTGTQRASE